MTHLEFLTLFGSFTNVGQENVSNSQTQQIREPLGVIENRQNLQHEKTHKYSNYFKFR